MPVSRVVTVKSPRQGRRVLVVTTEIPCVHACRAVELSKSSHRVRSSRSGRSSHDLNSQSCARPVIHRIQESRPVIDRLLVRARARRRWHQRLYRLRWLLLKRPARSASLVPLGAPHPFCCPVSLALLLPCMHASACSPLRSTVAMRALSAGASPSTLVGWPAAKSARADPSFSGSCSPFSTN